MPAFRYGPGSAAHHAAKSGALRCVRGTCILAYPNRSGFVILRGAPSIQPGAKGEFVMAKGQMRSNKEKKKPKADKNLKKGGAAPSPFSSGKTPAGQNPGKK
jgi:hypothetical protein